MKEIHSILKSITSWVVSHASDADQARDIGEKVVSKMVGKTVKEFTFRKKDIVVQINDKARTNIEGETLKLGPQLLFQRLVSATEVHKRSNIRNCSPMNL